MAVNRDLELLPCGTGAQALVAQVFGGAEPPSAVRLAHQETCPHCQTSLALLEALRRDMALVAAEPVGAPLDFARRVMARVRGSATDIELTTDALGSTTVAEALVGRIARLVAMEVPHVTFALAEVSTAEADDRVTLSVRLVVDYGVALHEIAAVVRERLVRKVRQTVGVRVGDVDVSIEELSG